MTGRTDEQMRRVPEVEVREPRPSAHDEPPLFRITGFALMGNVDVVTG
jgi:hypothetical protein